MNINHCIHCGTESEATWRFCRRCGTALENLESLATTAQCANCATALADGWRFCPNCGTGTDGAAPTEPGGLSSDEVADLIASPETAPIAPVPDDVASAGDAAAPAPVEPLAVEPAAAESTTAPSARPPTGVEPTTTEPPISDDDKEHVVGAPQVTFVPTAEEPAPEAVPRPAPEAAPADRDLDMMSAPPAPPADPSLADVAEFAQSRATAEAPPAPGLGESIPEAIPPIGFEPQTDLDDDVPASAAIIDVSPVPVVDEPAPFASQPAPPIEEPPAVIIPPVEAEPEIHIPEAPPAERSIRTDLPRPIGAPHEQSQTAIPRPLDTPAKERKPEPPRRERVTTPSTPTADLPPIDGRRFTNPGLIGQLVQLAMLLAAALGVAMVVAFTVLNNRLDGYATTGESLSRVESAQSIINTWMRPLLVVALLVAYVASVMWARRVLRNISVFDRFIPETALWMWVIPGANIFVLWQHLELAWKGSDVFTKDDPEWRKGRPNWWSFAFALLAILAFGVIIYAWLFMNSTTFENAIDANAVSIIGYGLVIASLLCGVRAVGSVVERQQSRVLNYD